MHGSHFVDQLLPPLSTGALGFVALYNVLIGRPASASSALFAVSPKRELLEAEESSLCDTGRGGAYVVGLKVTE